MNKAKALAWFAEVETKVPAFPNASARIRPRNVPLIDPYGEGPDDDADDGEEAADVRRAREYLAFVHAAEQAIKRTFPPGDHVVRRWDATFPHGDSGAATRAVAVLAGIALFREAHSLLMSDRFESLIEGVRAETVGELLDQAESLLSENWLSAAMVTAGGAVESTLRHLCERASPQITITGHGSIGAYRTAIEKQGTGILRANQHDMIKVWNKLRNEAAHEPMKFQAAHAKDGVQNTIDAIRIFLGSLPT